MTRTITHEQVESIEAVDSGIATCHIAAATVPMPPLRDDDDSSDDEEDVPNQCATSPILSAEYSSVVMADIFVRNLAREVR